MAVAAHDLLAAALAFVLAISFRVGTFDSGTLGIELAWFVGLFGLIANFNGLNRGIWRYASIADLEAIVVTATVTVSVFTIVMFVLNRLETIPRSTIFLSWVLVIMLLSGSRIAYRSYRNRRSSAVVRDRAERNVLLIGTGENTENFIKAMAERNDLPYKLLGIIDDRNKRVGQTIRGISVLGSLQQLNAVVERLSRSGIGVESFILTTTSVCAGRATFDELSKVAVAHKIELLRLPDMARTLRSGTAAANAIEPKPVELRDLLSRQSVTLDGAPVATLIRGESVLVTGAGGSIGSELCRQLLALGPQQLVLLDSSEFLLYGIHEELKRRGPGETCLIARLGDVRDRTRIMTLFSEIKPGIVFHAAALKHVPMVEAQPLEGLHTNVIGTRNIADASIAVGANAMVLVSTDKAINPTNVMGASKRMAEAYCQSLDGSSKTRFVTVRFGNVLGSAGSVVPLFEKQIAAGGPVTVTHPEIERFFMTIPEAVELILQATANGASEQAGRPGRIFVLDMGKPVKIVDIAHKMIRLSGHEPNKDIHIEFVGLRPGEKLYEELFAAREEIVASEIPALLIATPELNLRQSELVQYIDEIQRYVGRNELWQAIEIVKRVVPEYQIDERMGQKAAASTDKPALRVI